MTITMAVHLLVCANMHKLHGMPNLTTSPHGVINVRFLGMSSTALHRHSLTALHIDNNIRATWYGKQKQFTIVFVHWCQLIACC